VVGRGVEFGRRKTHVPLLLVREIITATTLAIP